LPTAAGVQQQAGVEARLCSSVVYTLVEVSSCTKQDCCCLDQSTVATCCLGVLHLWVYQAADTFLLCLLLLLQVWNTLDVLNVLQALIDNCC
jgi:hypothetical protein